MSILTDENSFKSDLDVASLRRAADELNEDAANRDGAVETLRDWVRQQPWLHSPTGTRFLMQFLRSCKFSQLKARQKLENYLKIRTEYKTWSSGRETTNRNIQEIFKTGFLIRLPIPDTDGRLVVLMRPGLLPMDQLKAGKHGGITTVFRAILCMLDWLSMDERSQVNGIMYLLDYTDFTFSKRSTLYSPTHVRQIIDVSQNGCCIRVKAFHFYNPDPFFEAGMTLARPFLKQKMRDRMIIHGISLVSLYKHVDMAVLPREYLPDEYTGKHCGTIADVLKFTLDELTSKPVFDYIKSLSTDYKVNLGAKPTDTQESASFRKLNID